MNAIKEEVTLKPQSLHTLFRRSVGLIWSLLLIGYLYLIVIWEGLLLRTDIRKTCDNEIELYAWNVLTLLGSTINTIGRAYVITCNEAEKNFQFDHY